MLRPLPALVLAFLLAAAPARAGEDAPSGGRLALLSGEVHRGIRLEALTEQALRFVDREGADREVAAAELVSLSLPGEVRATQAPDGDVVAVLLRGGDVVHGSLLPAGPERLGVRSPPFGEISFPVDEVQEVRFLRAWQEAPEKPSFAAGTTERDVFVYANLDRLEGSFLEVAGGQVLVHGRIGDRHPISFANLLAIRFADGPEPAATEGRRTVLLLADGSRLTAARATSDGHTVFAETVRGERLKFPQNDLRCLLPSGDRFTFLSDRPADEEALVPWIGEVYAWDRARYDRSLLDRPLSAGGQVFEKGIGVVSGTSLTFRLDGAAKAFTARVAVDDAAGAEGDVVFQVLVDGEVKFTSEVVQRVPAGDEPRRIPPVPLSGAKTLTLRVLYHDDSVSDFADWLEPVLLR